MSAHDRPTPPVAERRPLTRERFGITWRDDWAWLRDPGYPRVTDEAILAYLEAENAYTEAVMAPHDGMVDALFEELKGRIKEDESSVPVREGEFFYHWAFEPGHQYRTWFRAPLVGCEATLLLDENALAHGKDYFSLRAFRPSPDGRVMALTTDEDGSERFGLRLLNTATGTLGDTILRNLSGNVVWAADGRTLLYVELNESLRPFRVRAHDITAGPGGGDDPILFEEADPAFFVSIGRTRDGAWLLVHTGTHVTSEVRILPADRPFDEDRIIAPRRDGHRYGVDHAHGRFFMITNDRHENFRLVDAPAKAPQEENWRELIAGSDSRYLTGADCFSSFMAISAREDGIASVGIRRYDGRTETIAFPEAVHTARPGDNRTFDTDRLRLSYSSMITPSTIYDLVVDTGELVIRKVQEIPSGYDKSLYRTVRLHARSHDGTAVPVTIVHHKDFAQDGSSPAFLYGYGSYGMGMEPSFSANRLSLLERGFAFAIAHVRGGDELGYRWYLDGKLEKKENTFEDFIACAQALVTHGYARPGNIAIRGGSAGGLLAGAVLNKAPELWSCAVAEVPFVDVLNTILDPSLPLTPIEWPEWGNPLEDEAAFRRIMGYSPYENIEARAYPPMLVTAGIADPRVTYWEPAKYVARMRATRTDDNLLLLKTVMEGGHFGKSGRYESLRELALSYAFIFKCHGLLDPSVASAA